MVTCGVSDFGIRLCQFETDSEALVLKGNRAGPRYVIFFAARELSHSEDEICPLQHMVSEV
jgi:hypothetical protein